MTVRRRALERLARGLEAVSEATGRATAWLSILLVSLVSYDVAMRYAFRGGSVALQELEWHLFALIFLIGAAYTLKHDAHVRVDMLYQRLGTQGRAWVDLLGTLLFLLPFCVLVMAGSAPFVLNAFSLHEVSPDPGGLGYRYLIKSAIPLGFLLLALQGVAEAIKNILIILDARTVRKAAPHPRDVG